MVLEYSPEVLAGSEMGGVAFQPHKGQSPRKCWAKNGYLRAYQHAQAPSAVRRRKTPVLVLLKWSVATGSLGGLESGK